MRVLVACEQSGTVRDAFLDRGHDAYSCDLEPGLFPSDRHIVGDVTELLADRSWNLVIAHPPCTYLSVSGQRFNKSHPNRVAAIPKALEFFRLCLRAKAFRVCVENPVSIASSRIRPADQMIQPWMFGHDESKATCFWLKNLPKLKPTYMMKRPAGERYSNQTPSGGPKLPPSEDRAMLKAITYEGIAQAMADQWGKLDPV